MAIIQKHISKEQHTNATAKACKSSSTPWWKEQPFDYVQVPKDLFRAEQYHQLSPLAKLLYSFLLDRMNLSVAKGNRWKNNHNEYFVYFPISEIMERFNCGHDKAAALLKELEKANLVSRTLKGRGLPYQITVKPFVIIPTNQQSEHLDNRNADLEKIVGNKTDHNSTDLMHPEELIARSSREQVELMIKENIFYEILCDHVDVNILNGIVRIMADLLHQNSPYVRILGESISRDEVRKKILRINDMHIQYVIHRIKKETNNIQNTRSYIIARLYEAEDVMDSYYEIQVNHDMSTSRKENLK